MGILVGLGDVLCVGNVRASFVVVSVFRWVR